MQRLITAHAALLSALETNRTNLTLASRRRDEAAEKLRIAAVPNVAAGFRQAIDEAKSEQRIEADLDEARREREAVERVADTALRTLTLWRGDATGLASLALPLPGDEAEAARRLEETAKKLEEAKQCAERLRSELSALEERVARLESGEAVPTPDIVAGARSRRDRAWRLVRRALDGAVPAPSELADLPSGDLADGFEVLRDEADRLSDRRADEAQRVADYLACCAQRNLVCDRIRAEAETITARAAEAETARADWLQLWRPCGLIPGAPAAMQQWRRDRAEVVAHQLGADKARRNCEDLAARRDRARAGLAEFVPLSHPEETLASLLRRCEQSCAAAEQGQQQYVQLERGLQQEEQRLKESEQLVAAANGKFEDWRGEWSRGILALGFPAEASVDAAGAALDAWAKIAELLPSWQSEQQRLAQRQAAIESFVAEVETLQAALGDRSEEPKPAVVARLHRRLSSVRDAGRAADDLRRQIVEHDAARAEAEHRVADSTAQLDALHRSAGVTGDAELQQAIERASARAAAAADVARLERELLERGDGGDEAALRAEADAVDIEFGAGSSP